MAAPATALALAYYAIVIVALLTIAASFLIKNSKFGLGLMAIREDQDAAQVLGIDPARAKVIAYAISAFFPGLAGAIFFFKNGIIEPAIAFDLLRSIEALVMVMLGGYGTVTGPIVGARGLRPAAILPDHQLHLQQPPPVHRRRTAPAHRPLRDRRYGGMAAAEIAATAEVPGVILQVQNVTVQLRRLARRERCLPRGGGRARSSESSVRTGPARPPCST